MTTGKSDRKPPTPRAVRALADDFERARSVILTDPEPDERFGGDDANLRRYHQQWVVDALRFYAASLGSRQAEV
jgi:hypothetical protein